MVRRDAFLDVAQRLVQAKGFQSMSIQDVLDELNATTGAFQVASPDETATVFVSLMLGFQELANDYFIARQAGTITFAVVQRSVASFTEAFERILGIPKGSLTLIDESTLHFWFG